MKKFKFIIGGVQIGLACITVPFASLYITNSYIRINILFFTIYKLSKNKIISLSETNSGIEIKTVLPKKITFWCLNAKSVINSIYQIGFTPEANEKLFTKNKSFPVKIKFILLIPLLWGISFILDKFIPKIEKVNLGIFNSYGVIFNFIIFIWLILLWYCKPIQNLVLKKGHDFEEIKPEMLMLIFLTSFIWILIGLHFFQII